VILFLPASPAGLAAETNPALVILKFEVVVRKHGSQFLDYGFWRTAGGLKCHQGHNGAGIGQRRAAFLADQDRYAGGSMLNLTVRAGGDLRGRGIGRTFGQRNPAGIPLRRPILYAPLIAAGVVTILEPGCSRFDAVFIRQGCQFPCALSEWTPRAHRERCPLHRL
jgi:hypothetical protein